MEVYMVTSPDPTGELHLPKIMTTSLRDIVKDLIKKTQPSPKQAPSPTSVRVTQFKNQVQSKISSVIQSPIFKKELAQAAKETLAAVKKETNKLTTKASDLINSAAKDIKPIAGETFNKVKDKASDLVDSAKTGVNFISSNKRIKNIQDLDKISKINGSNSYGEGLTKILTRPQGALLFTKNIPADGTYYLFLKKGNTEGDVLAYKLKVANDGKIEYREIKQATQVEQAIISENSQKSPNLEALIKFGRKEMGLP